MRFPLKQTMAVARYIRRMKKAGVERFPIVLQLEPLHACNLSCSGCGRIREYKDHLSKMLTLEQCFRAIDESRTPVVSICGGEPLLYPHLQALVEGCIARDRVVYLCTNGQVLAQKLDLLAPHPLFNINVHLDGLSQTHDAIVERPGAFDRAVAGIAEARRAGFNVCTNTTIYRQTEAAEVKALIDYLDGLGVNGMLISPGFDYADVADQSQFLTRDAIIRIFTELREAGRGKRIWSTPLFLDFLAGKREYTCSPWGTITYNVLGWKAPCYLITDRHYDTFESFYREVPWDRYGPGRDPRCRNCMCHCGFEPTVALTSTSSIRDAMTMARWTFF